MATRKTKAADAELDAVKDIAELDPIAAAVKAITEPNASGELAALTSGGLVDPGTKVFKQSDIDRLQAEIDALTVRVDALYTRSNLSSTDLNSVTNQGNYVLNFNNNTYSHAPAAFTTGTAIMYVRPHAAGNRLLQIIVGWTDGSLVYIRNVSQGQTGAGTWYKITTT